MSTTHIPDYTKLPILRPDLTTLVQTLQEWYATTQGDADKAGDIEDHNLYAGSAYAYHDVLTYLTARQCVRCGKYEGDETIQEPEVCLVGGPDGKHVWDNPQPEPDYKALFTDLFVKVAESEPPEGSQLDEVLTEFQEQYDVASATDSATCRHCGHGILRQPSGVWIAPDAGLDREFGDGMWRDICPDNDDHPNPPHEPGA